MERGFPRRRSVSAAISTGTRHTDSVARRLRNISQRGTMPHHLKRPREYTFGQVLNSMMNPAQESPTMLSTIRDAAARHNTPSSTYRSTEESDLTHTSLDSFPMDLDLDSQIMSSWGNKEPVCNLEATDFDASVGTGTNGSTNMSQPSTLTRGVIPQHNSSAQYFETNSPCNLEQDATPCDQEMLSTHIQQHPWQLSTSLTQRLLAISILARSRLTGEKYFGAYLANLDMTLEQSLIHPTLVRTLGLEPVNFPHETYVTPFMSPLGLVQPKRYVSIVVRAVEPQVTMKEIKVMVLDDDYYPYYGIGLWLGRKFIHSASLEAWFPSLQAVNSAALGVADTFSADGIRAVGNPYNTFSGGDHPPNETTINSIQPCLGKVSSHSQPLDVSPPASTLISDEMQPGESTSLDYSTPVSANSWMFQSMPSSITTGSSRGKGWVTDVPITPTPNSSVSFNANPVPAGHFYEEVSVFEPGLPPEFDDITQID